MKGCIFLHYSAREIIFQSRAERHKTHKPPLVRAENGKKTGTFAFEIAELSKRYEKIFYPSNNFEYFYPNKQLTCHFY